MLPGEGVLVLRHSIGYMGVVNEIESFRPALRHNPYTLLLGSLVLILVVWPVLAPLQMPGLLGSVVHGSLFTLLLLAIGHVVRPRHGRRWLFGLLGLALLGEWADGLILGRGTTVFGQSAAALLLAAVTMFVLRRVFAPGRVTADRIVAAMCAYLFLGMFWATLFALIHEFVPAAFHFPEGTSVHPTDFTYFSFVTLTTLGYGDITPVSPLARSLAYMEAVFGQIFIAVVIARLVALELMDSHKRTD